MTRALVGPGGGLVGPGGGLVGPETAYVLTPAPVAIALVVPVPAIDRPRALHPSPVAIHLAIPAPFLGTLVPSPVAIALVIPTPTITFILAPSPVAIPLFIPVPVLTGGIRTLVPSPVAIALVIPTPSVTRSLASLHQLFDLLAVSSALSQPFDLLAPDVSVTLHQLFDLTGPVGSTLSQPFDFLTDAVGASLRQLFDLLGSAPLANEVQVIASGGPVTSYVLTFDGQSTGAITGTANAATAQAALEALSNLAPGDITITGGPLNTADLVITFGGTLAGINVPQITVVATGISGTPPIAGTTTTGGPTSSGGGLIQNVPLLWLPLMVFDKAGRYLGSIAAFNVTIEPVRYLRSRRVTNEGGMTFNVSRHSPDIGLIASDRLVRLQSVAGETPWWGTMSPQVSAKGIQEVTCKDPFTVLRDGLAITLTEEVGDDTPATGVYARIMGIHNDLRATNGEAQWELDLQGSRPFRGDIDVDTDTLSCLDTIIGRSRTEIAWDSRLEGNRLVPILRARDSFAAGAGAAIYDGPGGNVTAGAQVVEDPTPLVFSIRLRGLTTDLAKCLPEWAQWALLDVTPEATVSVDPGERRMRQVLEESLDWGLSKAAVAAQCAAIQAWIWELYRSFLRAVHDIEGRPWHDGWAFLGPPAEFEPTNAGKDSLSRRAWRTRLQLVELQDNVPASAVMISDKNVVSNLREWLVVAYDRVTGVQSVWTWAIPTVVGAALIKWNAVASVTVYKVSGGRIVSRAPEGPTGAFVDPYSVRIWDPVAKRYRYLRRIINGDWALNYWIDPADSTNHLVDMGADAAVDQVAGDGSSLIGKAYDFELDRIDDYDPRRDGIGILKSALTVFNGAETSRPRWHIASFDVGGDATTSLTTGISAGDADFEVDSIMGFPDPDAELSAFPFLAWIDQGSNREVVLVLSMLGTLWHVVRGQLGTEAIIHEAGAPVGREGVGAWAGFPFPYTWPEGEQWAADELAELSRPRIDVGVHVAHFRDDQLTIAYGSTHAVNVATEGAPGRWSGTGRAIGWSTGDGETEVVLQWLP
jgi:hypothetical protein